MGGKPRRRQMNDSSDSIEGIAEKLAQTPPPKHCLLCGRKPFLVGLFSPHGQAPDLRTIVRYVLCRRCSGRRDKVQRVEAILLPRLARATGKSK